MAEFIDLMYQCWLMRLKSSTSCFSSLEIRVNGDPFPVRAKYQIVLRGKELIFYSRSAILKSLTLPLHIVGYVTLSVVHDSSD